VEEALLTQFRAMEICRPTKAQDESAGVTEKRRAVRNSGTVGVEACRGS